MAKKKKKPVYQYSGPSLPGIKPPNPLENINYPQQDPMAELRRIQNLPKVPGLPTQDYGVKALDPQADLTAQLGQYPGKKQQGPQTNWGDVATNALLLTNMLLPGDPIRNPVVRPQVGYSPQPQGRGSQANYQYGGPIIPYPQQQQPQPGVDQLFGAFQGLTQPFADAKSGLLNAFTGGMGSFLPMKQGGKISNTGYKRNSKDKNQPNLRIPSNQITMQDVDFPVIGISDTGDTQYMVPGEEYSFDGNYVDEFPQAKDGLNFKSAGAYKKWLGYVHATGLAESTPGHQKVSIEGKKHKVKHENGGGLSREEDYGSKKKPYPSVKSGDFAGGGRSYPIPTKADAVDALRLAGLHGRSDVRAKVFKKYPELKHEFGGIIEEYNNGGSLSPTKASEILHDGTIRGKKITDKQRRYFGFVAGGGEAQNGANIVGTPQQREQANITAQRLSQKYGLANAPNMQIGQFLPQYVDEAGNPVQAMQSRQLPTTVPNYVNLEDIQTEQGLYWYVDPKTGNTVDVDPSVVRAKRFQKSAGTIDFATTNTANKGTLKYGGKAQNGAVFTSEEQLRRANEEAQRFATARGMIGGNIAGYRLGDPVPQYVTPSGQPYVPTPARPLPMSVPGYVQPGDIQQVGNEFSYIDEKTGDIVPVDPSVVNLPRFRRSAEQTQVAKAERNVARGIQNMKLNFNYGGKTPYKGMYMHGGSVTPMTDDTFQINGPSHSDGGVDLMYGDQGVEVEGGETGYQANDGSLNIMGNMINPLTGRKFKDDSKIIAKKEQKIDKLLGYSLELVDESDPKDKWGMLKFNSGRVQMEGAFKKKEELSRSKEHLSTIQQAMLDYASENNLDPGAFSKGQFKAAKADGTAQNGKKLSLAQRHNNPGNLKFAKWMTKYGATPGDPGKDGGAFAKFPSIEAGQQAMVSLLKDKNYQKRTVEDAISRWTNKEPYKNIPSNIKGKKVSELDNAQFNSLLNTITQGEDSKTYNWEGITEIPQTTVFNQGIEEAMGVTQTPFNPQAPIYAPKREPGRVGRTDYDTTITPPTQYQLPSDARGLSLTQILPEIYTAATNQVEPVFMQEYVPQLYQDYEVSFQDRLNENQGTFSALARAVGNDPSTLSTLAAQKYQADQQVLADEFRTNQAIEQDVVNKNISLLNDAELKNLGLADTQFVRQSTARSKTKQQNQIVLQSIADKIHDNLYEQRLLKTYENLYPNYRFGEDYQTDFTGDTAADAINWNTNSVLTPLNNAQVTIREDNKGNIRTEKKYPSSIQQSLQNIDYSIKKQKYSDLILRNQRKAAKDYNK